MTTQNEKAYYDTRWSETPLFHNGHEHRRLVEILRCIESSDFAATDEARICDLGCGRGLVAYHLARFGRVTAYDISSAAVKLAASRWPEITFREGDATNLNDQTGYDLVVSSEVLEHIKDKNRFLDTVMRMVKPRGHLIITTPNARLFSRTKRAGAHMQPVEEWIGPRKLHNLFKPYFRTICQKTFLSDASADLLVPAGVRAVTRRRKLRSVQEFLFSAVGLGFYQIYLGQRRQNV